MRIVFMGTPEFAKDNLVAIHQAGYEIAAVYSQPDRPSGRGHKLLPTPVKEYAIEHNIPVQQPLRVREQAVIDDLAKLAPDVIVVVAYGQILPKAILDIPRYGCLNVHASVLPKYRGAAPIHWAILNGDTQTGVTIMQMDEGMDTGDILAVATEEILADDTTETLHDKLKVLGAKLLVETLEKMPKGTIKPKVQDHDKASYTTLIKRDMEKIDWQQSATSIHNKIRALRGAYTLDKNGNILKLHKSIVMENNCPDDTIGSVIAVDKEGFVVKCGSGVLKLLEVQPANRKRMTAAAYVQGYSVAVGDVFLMGDKNDG